MTYTFGIEIETTGVSISRVENALDRAGVRGCKVVPDGTPTVDAEIVLPPLGNQPTAVERFQRPHLGCRLVLLGIHEHPRVPVHF